MLSTAFTAFTKNPNNVTTCIGSNALFTCEVNETIVAIHWTVNGASITDPTPPSTLSIPATSGALVQCYYGTFLHPVAFSSPAFLTVLG